MAHIKYVIFDFDGTLVDSRRIFLPIFNQLAEKHGFKKLSGADLEKLKSRSLVERARFLDFPMGKLSFMAAEFYRLYKRSLGALTFFEGIEELLRELTASGLKLAVISSNSKKNISTFFEQKNIDCFDRVICSSKIFGKDAMIDGFLKANKLLPSEVIYVGDEQRDVVACRKSGIKVIWVPWGFDSLEVFEAEGPDYTVEKPREILSIIQSANVSAKFA
ncbi:MAG TPA: HAD family hydrolase [Cyanobacteria bacterium UBA8530]|nr:HAD family hydrolase [Cyanobacteria bacterium UBA8530]